MIKKIILIALICVIGQLKSSYAAEMKGDQTVNESVLPSSDGNETLFSVKGAVKSATNAVKDAGKKVVDTTKNVAEKAIDTTKNVVKTGAHLTKQGLDMAKAGVQKVFKMTVDFAKKVPWTTVFKEGLNIAVPALKGCVKAAIVAAPAELAAAAGTAEFLGAGGAAALAGACAIGAGKASIPAIMGVSASVYNSWSGDKKKQEIQKQIDINESDYQAIGASISQASASKGKLSSKEEKDAADIAIGKAKGTQAQIGGFVKGLKAELSRVNA